MRQQRFDGLTGLKGLFSLVIVFFHTLPITPLIERIPLSSFVRNFGGGFGNSFFFVVGGFLISMGYRDRISGGQISFRDFLVKRLRRLYPLYLITNLVSLVVNSIQFGASAIDLKRILFTALLQNGGGLSTEYPYNGPSWFVSALLCCYLVFFFFAYHSKHATAYRCLIAGGIVWGYSIASGRWMMPLAFAHHGDSFFAFFSGCALAEIYPLVARKNRGWFAWPAAGILLAALGMMMRYGVEIIAGDIRVVFAWLVCPLLIYLALFSRLVSRILQCRPLKWLGDISFSVYLWHFVIYDIFRYTYAAVCPGKAIEEPQYLLYLVLTLLVSILSHRIQEGKRPEKTASR